MTTIDLGYARALWAAAPLTDLARAVVRRARPQQTPSLLVDDEARRLGADALQRAPRLFSAAPIDEAHRALFPDAAARVARRAEEILSHRVELYGRSHDLGERVEWLRDPSSGFLYDAEAEPDAALALVLDDTRADAKLVWELQRGGHLVQLGAAARLCPSLAHEARAEVAAQLQGFLDQVRPGRGLAYASPLEVALRGIHWLAAIELCGGARRFSRPLVERCAGALLADLQWLWARKEDRGVAPANHLLGDLVGAWALALALDGAPGARPLLTKVQHALEHEATRQVGPDGAHFEASIGYHRFALELLLVAHLYARSSGRALAVAAPLRRMFAYLRGVLQPDGTDPGFGDADDTRLVPVVARDPRQHAWLLPVGAVLFDDASLRAPDAAFSEEALWLLGPAAYDCWRWLGPAPSAPSASFVSGGVHVMRDRDVCVALRAGPYGQHGVGGHAHNDQLALVIHAGGAPLVVDAGTGCYTQDPLLRDRLRSTSAHSTVIVEGAEQSPLPSGRPFALPDRARARRVRAEDLGVVASLEAEHHGYRRLPMQVTHRRHLTLFRSERMLLVEDRLEGRGEAGVEVRFLVAGAVRAPTSLLLSQLSERLGAIDCARVLDLDGRAALVPLGEAVLTARIEPGLCFPRWQSRAAATLVAAAGRPRLPVTVRHALVFSR